MSQLKEINGRYYQEAEVVMIATKNYHSNIELDERLILTTHKGYANKNGQHLYILSNEEIKEGDWCIDKYNQIWQFLDNCLIGFDADKNKRFRTDNVEGHKVKKIIATTDASLYVPITQDKPFDELPQPSDSFIKKYIEEYNKGNIITNILVGYLPCECQFQHEPELCERLKVDSDNTITIKRVEPELYTREEIEILITNAFKAGYERSHSGYPHTDNWSKPKVEEFLKENL